MSLSPDSVASWKARRLALGRLVLVFLVGAAIVVGLPVLVWALVAPSLASRALSHAGSDRPAGRESLDDLLRRFPRTMRNESTRRLEILAARIGIDAAPRADGRAPKASGPAKAAWDASRGPLTTFWEVFLLRADDVVPPLPGDVRTLLSRNASAIPEIEEHLRNGAPLVWDRDLAKGYGHPLPNLLGVIHLNRLLAAEALQSDGEGRSDEAERTLEALFRMQDALAERPELICHVMALATDRILMKALRCLRRPSADLRKRTGGVDWTGAHALAVRSHALEALAAARLVLRGEDRELGLTENAILTPYFCFSFAEHVRRLDDVGASLATLGPTELETGEIARRWRPRPARWNVTANALWPMLESASYRVLHRVLDRELTALVLGARRGDVASGRVPVPRWPGHEWRVEVGAGRVEIELTPRHRDAALNQDFEIPLRFSGSMERAR